MADQQLHEGSSISNVSGGNSESTVELNIKTLDSRIYTFQVDKNIGILAFKEKIAGQSGVPVGQQRLIFRGKVLKDGHLLSDYNVEKGDTLHLVERQPQPSLGSGTGEATPSNDGSRGQDSAAGGSRNRIGQIAHSVVLGTVNVGDSGEAVVPDLSRVIGAVLNSIGIGNLAAGMQPNVQTQGHETEGSQANNGTQSRGQSNAMPIPLGAMLAIPSLNMPIPDSLNTLIEYMNRMGLALSQNADQRNQSPAATGDLPTIDLSTNPRGVPSVGALSIVLRHAQCLLNDHAVAALSHSAGRLEQEGASADPTVRGQVQTELMRLGAAVLHLGSLFLELGRTILTLRMGQSQAESFVNAGPAVYISPSGPNPIMVQPFPLQTNPLFGGSTSVASNPVAMGSVGVGNAPRNVNIHIHTGASLVPMVSQDNREGSQGEHASGSDSGPARFPSGLNVTGMAVPSRPAVVSSSGPIQLAVGVSQPLESNSAVAAELNAQARNLVANMPSENHAPLDGLSGQRQPVDSGARNDMADSGVRDAGQSLPHAMGDQKAQPEFHHPHTMKFLNSNDVPSTSAKGSSHNLSRTSEHVKNLEGPNRSNQGNDDIDGSVGVPLGLGLGGLQHKRRDWQRRGQAKNSNGATASNHNMQSRVGQQVLQSLASLPTRRNENISARGQSPDHSSGVIDSMSTSRQNADGPINGVNAMSEALQSPAIDGLLAGVSRQTGIGSPDMMRNMLQQFTQNPAMRNTMNQIAQQIDSHDLGSMFAGMGGQGGGIDLVSMMQQMMPIVSQALGGVSSASQQSFVTEPVLTESRSRRDTTPNRINTQIDIQQVVQTLESPSSPEEIFRSLAGTAVGVLGDTNAGESILNYVCTQEGLAQEFVEMLRRDVSGRLEDEKI